jgi:hypothetical protein
MTADERKALVMEYLGRLDRGQSVLSLFHAEAELAFPKWGVARGHGEIQMLFTDLGGFVKRLVHVPDESTLIVDGTRVAIEGRTSGIMGDGARWDVSDHDGRWCSVFDIREHLICRCAVYLDPDLAGSEAGRYPWSLDQNLGWFRGWAISVEPTRLNRHCERLRDSAETARWRDKAAD